MADRGGPAHRAWPGHHRGAIGLGDMTSMQTLQLGTAGGRAGASTRRLAARWLARSTELAALAAFLAITVPGLLAQGTIAIHPAEPAESAGEASAESPGEHARGANGGAHAGRISAGEAEIFIGAYGGAPYTYRSDVRLKRPGGDDFTAHKVGWDGKPFVDPIYYGLRVTGWSGRAPAGAMFDFTHSKTYSRLDEVVSFTGTKAGEPITPKARLRDIYRRLEFTHGHNMLTLNALYRLPFRTERVRTYVGVGAGIAIPHAEVRVQKDPGRTYEYQVVGPAFQALIGLEFRVPNISYFLEYKFTFASYNVSLTHAAKGNLWTRLVSHQVIGGLGWRIARRPAVAK